MSKRIRWITRTAVFLALTVVLQLAAAQFGNQFITGSVVNLLLIVSTVTCGFATGTAIAIIAPVFIRLIGVGLPFWPIVPFIALGNLVLVSVWFFADRLGSKARVAGKAQKSEDAENAQETEDAQETVLTEKALKAKKTTAPLVAYIVALPVAAVLKTAALYAGVIMFAAPVVIGLDPVPPAISLAYSWPQLVTASIAGAVAIAILPMLKKALGSRGGE